MRFRGASWRSGAPKKVCATTSRAFFIPCGLRKAQSVVYALVGETLGPFLGFGDLSGGREDFHFAIDRQRLDLHELRNRRGRVVDLQLLHQKREALLERLADGLARVLADAPHLLLERTD